MRLSEACFLSLPLPYFTFYFSLLSLSLTHFLSPFALRESVAMLWVAASGRVHRQGNDISSNKPEKTHSLPTAMWMLLEADSVPVKPWDDSDPSWHLDWSLEKDPDPEAPS